MRILFVQPNPRSKNKKDKSTSPLSNRIISKFSVFSPQLTFPMLAAVTPKEHKIEIINERYKQLDYRNKYDIVGISFRTFEAKRAYEIADKFRKRGNKVVLGGWHVSALPEEAKEHADSVVVGEAEELWPQLLNDLNNGGMKPFYIQQKAVDPTLLCSPTKINLRGHLESVQATRGCPNGCHFCSIYNTKFRNIYRKRPIENVIEEIENLPSKSFSFLDASLTIDVKYSKELFKSMIGLNKKFGCSGNVNRLCKDEELLKLAYEAGCMQWLIGFESVTQESLDGIGKKTNKVEMYKSVIKKIHDYGMTIKGEFIFGFDNDKPDVFEKTLEMLNKMDIDMMDFYILTPYPGTPLYNNIVNEKRLLTKDWSKYDCKNVVFQPKNMAPEELLEGTKYVGRQIHSYSNIVRRYFSNVKRNYALWTVIQNFSNRNYFKKFT